MNTAFRTFTLQWRQTTCLLDIELITKTTNLPDCLPVTYTPFTPMVFIGLATELLAVYWVLPSPFCRGLLDPAIVEPRLWTDLRGRQTAQVGLEQFFQCAIIWREETQWFSTKKLRTVKDAAKTMATVELCKAIY